MSKNPSPSPEPPKSLLQVVEEYFATVTPEQFEQDMRAANFDYYNKVGAPVYSLEEAIALATKQSNQIPSRLFRGTRQARTKRQEKY